MSDWWFRVEGLGFRVFRTLLAYSPNATGRQNLECFGCRAQGFSKQKL